MAKVHAEGASRYQQHKDFEDNKTDETIKGETKVFVDAGTNPAVSFNSGGFVRAVVPKGAASRKGVEIGFSLLRILGVQNEVFKIEENLTESGLKAKIAEFVQLGHPYECIFANPTRQAEISRENEEQAVKNKKIAMANREAELRDQISTLTENFSASHPDTVKACRDLSTLLVEMDSKEAARNLLRTIVDIQTDDAGEDDIETLNSKKALAIIDLTMGQIGEGVTLLREILTVQSSKWGRQSTSALETMIILGIVLFHTGNFKESNALFTEATKIPNIRELPHKQREGVLKALGMKSDPFEYALKNLEKRALKEHASQKAADAVALELKLEAEALEKEWLLVKENGLHLRHSPPDLQNDRAFVLEAVRQNGFALAYAPIELRDDLEISIEAVKENGFSLYFVSENRAKDPRVVLSACNENGFALQYASDSMLVDKVRACEISVILN